VSGGSGTSKVSQLWFTAPCCVEIREATLPEPGPNQVLVKTRYSAVSAGTELLVYRGQLPHSIALDSGLESLQRSTDYPLQFGYACIGEIQQTGSAVDPKWQGRQVFSFQPHASHFLACPDELQQVPDDLSPQDAVFLPNMETAVNLVQDGQPLVGERVVVIGQGIVGLLVSAILARYPLLLLAAVEGQPERQELARRMGVNQVYSPAEATAAAGSPERSFESSPERSSKNSSQPGQPTVADADLIFEVSGDPAALNLAIALSGYASRIVIGSWYGSKTAPIELGGKAHRNRLQLITSQVSTLAPALTGRWDKQRRFDVAWEMIRRVGPQQLISHTLPLQEAGYLYQQLHEQQPGFTQALFHYPD
jgi:2-desacetyl-2-hydroxyethyl bacteriochlorophyllide A dehydrogenase